MTKNAPAASFKGATMVNITIKLYINLYPIPFDFHQTDQNNQILEYCTVIIIGSINGLMMTISTKNRMKNEENTPSDWFPTSKKTEAQILG